MVEEEDRPDLLALLLVRQSLAKAEVVELHYSWETMVEVVAEALKVHWNLETVVVPVEQQKQEVEVPLGVELERVLKLENWAKMEAVVQLE